MAEFFLFNNAFLETCIILMLILIIILWRNAWQHLSSKIFIALIVSTIFWIFANLIANLTIRSSENLYFFWTKMTMIGPIFIPIFLILFTDSFAKEKFNLNRLFIWGYSILTLIFLTFVPTSLYIKSIKIVDIENFNSSFYPGTLFIVFIVYFILSILIALIIFWNKYKSFSIIQKKQAQIIICGIILSILGGILVSAILPIFGHTELINISPASTIFFIGLTTYAIIRHHFLNIRILTTEILVTTMEMILLVQALLSKTLLEGLTRGILFVLGFYFGYLLIKSVINEIERRKEVEVLAKRLKIVNADLLTLQNINNKMVSTLDVKKVSQEIVESLVSELSWKGGFLALVDDAKNRLYIQAMTRKIALKVRPHLAKPIKKYSLPLLSGNSILQQALRKFEIEFSSDLSKVIKGAIEAETAKKIQKELKVETFACAPIVYRGKVIGALVIGFDKEKEKITAEEKKMISSIADQAAIAIENAKLYEEIEKANVKLKELDQLKNEFLSIASHQVRTPLSIIKGYISLLRSNHKVGPLNEQQDHFMKNIQEANEQLINIINDFLNLSRIEQKRMKLEISESDMEKLIEQVIERLNHEAELKNIKLNFVKQTLDIPKINIDEPKIIEVITNLIDNAIKYSPEKSEIKIKLEKNKNQLLISVADQGIGIPKDFQDKLFQKFSRAHNAIQAQPSGNGIGLFLVKKIVDAHQGKIKVKTKEGEGTTFIVSLNYKSDLKPGEEVDASQLEKEGIIRYDEYKS